MNLDSIGVSPCPVEIASGAADFTSSTYALKGVPWGGVRAIKVTGAGSLVVVVASPRDGHATESYTMEAGQTIPGQFVKIEASTSGGCYPLVVFP